MTVDILTLTPSDIEEKVLANEALSESNSELLDCNVVCIGDSLTANGYPSYLQALFPNLDVINNGVSGETAQEIISSQLLKSAGSIQSYFFESFFPWVDSGTIASITGERLRVYQSAADYVSLSCLNNSAEVTISGNYASDGTSYLQLKSSEGETILTTVADGDFTVDFTPSADGEEVQIFITNGTAGVNYIDIREIKIELTDKSNCGDKIVLLCGTNDVGDGVAESITIDAVKFILENAQQNGIECTLVQIPPRDVSVYDIGVARSAEYLNNVYMGLCERFVDLSILYDGLYKRNIYDSGDGVHFNALGYSVIANEIAKALVGNQNNALSRLGSFEQSGVVFDAEKQYYPVLAVSQNDVDWSDDFSNWTDTRMTSVSEGSNESNQNDSRGIPLKYWELVPNTDNNDHYVRATKIIQETGTQIVKVLFKTGSATPWQRLRIAIPGAYDAYVNIETGEIGTGTSAFLNVSYERAGDNVLFAFETPTATAGDTLDVRIFPNPNGGTYGTFAGDGSTVYTYVAYVQSLQGTLQTTVDYVSTRYAANARRETTKWIDSKKENTQKFEVVNASTWDCGFDTRQLNVDYTATGAATITLLDECARPDWGGVLIDDSGDTAGTNNITIQNSTPSTVATISSNGGSYFLYWNGSEFKAR